MEDTIKDVYLGAKKCKPTFFFSQYTLCMNLKTIYFHFLKGRQRQGASPLRIQSPDAHNCGGAGRAAGGSDWGAALHITGWRPMSLQSQEAVPVVQSLTVCCGLLQQLQEPSTATPGYFHSHRELVTTPRTVVQSLHTIGLGQPLAGELSACRELECQVVLTMTQRQASCMGRRRGPNECGRGSVPHVPDHLPPPSQPR